MSMRGVRKFLDGRLFQYLEQLFYIQDIKYTKYIDVPNLRRGLLANLIVQSRYDGINWCYSPDEIEEVMEDVDESYWQLPSIELHHFFDIDNCHDLKKLFKKEKCDIDDIIWDTEASAWYPMFKNRAAAVKCIQDLNRLFDDRFLKKLEEIEPWE